MKRMLFGLLMVAACTYSLGLLWDVLQQPSAGALLGSKMQSATDGVAEAATAPVLSGVAISGPSKVATGQCVRFTVVAVDQNGRPFKIETLPMPRAVIHDGTRLPASYANFYIANRAVLMPTFDAPTDALAAATLSRLLPGRVVVGVPSTDLVWGLGSVHCLSQQHPAP